MGRLGRAGGNCTAAALAIVAALAVAMPAGAAEPPPLVANFGGVGLAPGGGAGQLDNPRGIATDPVTGHVYVADLNNRRVGEFAPWGRFVKAFGWDAAAGAVNEQQEVRVRAGAGEFKLSFVATSTPELAHDASGEEVEAALNALVTIGGVGGEASVEEIIGKADGSTPWIYIVTFKGSLAGTDVAQLVIGAGTPAPSGGKPSSTLEVRTLAGGVSAAHTGLEACTAESGCQKGTSGSGVGQLTNPPDLATDSKGDIYVIDRNNRRVQKFSPAGEFLLMIGGNVDKGGGTPANPGNLCTTAFVASGDDCTGVAATSAPPGNTAGKFDAWKVGAFIDVDSSDRIYVGDNEKIQKFSPAGVWQEDIDLLGCGFVLNLAVDPLGDIYTTCEDIDGVSKFDSDGSPFGEPYPLVPTFAPLAIAADAEGRLYVTKTEPNAELDWIFRFSRDGEEETTFGEPQAGMTGSGNGLGNGLGNGTECPPSASPKPGGVYASYVQTGTFGYLGAYGPPPVCFESPPPAEPEIVSQLTVSADIDSARVQAQINPHFWDDATYFVEYGTGDCSGGGCEGRAPLSDAQLGGGATESPVVTAEVFIEGLAPDAVYHYRFVAESSGGGPVFGTDRTFRTFAPALPAPACDNDAVRGVAAAHLPDCRGYEMVSPLDKNGGDIQALGGPGETSNHYTSYKQASPDGEKLTYSSATVFGDAPGGPFSSQYISSRGDEEGGWETHGISAPRGTAIFEGNPRVFASTEVDNMFEAFSADLSSAWLRDTNAEPLTSDGLVDHLNLYRRDNLSDAFEALTNEGPFSLATEFLNDQSEPGVPRGQGPGLGFGGHSADLSHQVFSSTAALTLDAAPIEAVCDASATVGLLTYRWLADGEPIAGASEEAYTPTAAEAGKALQCQAFAIDSANDNVGAIRIADPAWIVAPTSPRAAPLPPTPGGIPAPTADEPLEEGSLGGQTLACDANAEEWGRKPTTFAYRWYRNAVEIPGAEESTYVVSASDLASEAVFQCVVSGSNAELTVSAASRTLATTPAPSPEAPAFIKADMNGAKTQLYDLHNGQLELVSVLPSEEANPDNSYAGMLGVGATNNRESNVEHAVSEDGERIFWTSNPNGGGGPGEIYARIDGTVTIPLSEEGEEASGTSASRYWTAAKDGSEALFTSGGDLYRFDVDKAFGDLVKAIFGEAEATTLVAGEVAGVAGAADDLSHIYFASKEALAPGAEAGKLNLYLDKEGTKSLVAVLTTEDAPDLTGQISPFSFVPIRRASRVTPDGGAIAFQAVSNLTGYDTFNPLVGKRFTEVYRYDAGSDQLACVSCNPTEAAPSGLDEIRHPYSASNISQLTTDFGTAALLPTWEREHHASRLLSDDGSRLFFESYEALVPRDTNGTRDVYQWEEATGAGEEAQRQSCAAQGTELYLPSSAGCLSLISTGTSPQHSEFIEASATGDDVFIATTSSIDPRDEGLIDIYDARVGGGFPIPPPPTVCVGDACQPVPSPLEDPTPASAALQGPEDPQLKRCPQGKRKVVRRGKPRCVPKKKKAKRQQRRKRRAAR